jgi:hypothetical protein
MTVARLEMLEEKTDVIYPCVLWGPQLFKPGYGVKKTETFVQ